jgi:hypothetical protein
MLIDPAGMAELADAHGLGPCAERRAGSSPVPGTMPCIHRKTTMVITETSRFVYLSCSSDYHL